MTQAKTTVTTIFLVFAVIFMLVITVPQFAGSTPSETQQTLTQTTAESTTQTTTQTTTAEPTYEIGENSSTFTAVQVGDTLTINKTNMSEVYRLDINQITEDGQFNPGFVESTLESRYFETTLLDYGNDDQNSTTTEDFDPDDDGTIEYTLEFSLLTIDRYKSQGNMVADIKVTYEYVKGDQQEDTEPDFVKTNNETLLVMQNTHNTFDYQNMSKPLNVTPANVIGEQDSDQGGRVSIEIERDNIKADLLVSGDFPVDRTFIDQNTSGYELDYKATFIQAYTDKDGNDWAEFHLEYQYLESGYEDNQTQTPTQTVTQTETQTTTEKPGKGPKVPKENRKQIWNAITMLVIAGGLAIFGFAIYS